MRKKNNKKKANPIKRQAKVVISIMDKMYEKQRDTLAWDDDFFEEFKVCVIPRIEASLKSVLLRNKNTQPRNKKKFRKGGGNWTDKQVYADSPYQTKYILYPIAQYFMKDAMEVWNDLND